MSEHDTHDLFRHPRISQVTIARLHNRGDYEHSRYEVTVEIPRGVNPGSVMQAVDDMLGDLAPKPPCSQWSLHDAHRRLMKHKPVPGNAQDDSERDAAAALIKRYDEWSKRREAAFAKFTHLNGVERFVDGKSYWTRDDDGR